MQQTVTDDMDRAVADHPHLREHVEDWYDEHGRYPRWVTELTGDMQTADELDVIYPVGDPIFIHLHGRPDKDLEYTAVEPPMPDDLKPRFRDVKDRILSKAVFRDEPEDADELRSHIDDLFETHVTVDGGPGLAGKLSPFPGSSPIEIPGEHVDVVRYYLHRDIVDHGPLEPVIRDDYIEDIHSIGLEPIRLIHKIFDLVQTNVRFESERQLSEFLRTMSERIGRPVSDSRPIVDATLPDGSRINIVFSDDVSLKGSSFTIRKFEETPLSMAQIVDWGTLSPRMAAYIWLCLEYGQSMFVCGETASGKTTTLNASLPFIRPNLKVLSAEDTPEVQPPQPTWQKLVTREQGPEEARVEMFDLLRAALRSRPNYIVVGEIRGAEGNVAFQAMQTGHPVLSTFHAASVQKMIQRLSSPPINVPITFMDNLNVALIQQAVYQNGRMLRRVLGVEEIEGYSEHQGGVVTRAVFRWDPDNDEHHFRGMNNSFVLEDRIAQIAGYEDTRMIYDELERRARIVQGMIDNDMRSYGDVTRTIWTYYRKGLDALPFDVEVI